MQQHELRELITQSWTDDWHRIGEGPYFKDRWGMSWNSDGHMTFPDGHHSYAVFKADLDISLSWGMDFEMRSPSDPGLEYEYPWLEHGFPDKKAHPQFVDVYLRGNLVERELLVGVDGGRGLLPYPDAQYDEAEPRDYANVTWVVPPWQFKLARLTHSFEHPQRDFDRYFASAGFQRLD